MSTGRRVRLLPHLVHHKVVVAAIIKPGGTSDGMVDQCCGLCFSGRTETSRSSSSLQAATWSGCIWNRTLTRLLAPEQDSTPRASERCVCTLWIAAAKESRSDLPVRVARHPRRYRQEWPRRMGHRGTISSDQEITRVAGGRARSPGTYNLPTLLRVDTLGR